MEILVPCMRARHSLMSLKKSDGVSLISRRSSSTIYMFSWAAAQGRCRIDDAVGCVVAHALSSPNAFGRDTEDGSDFVGVPPQVNDLEGSLPHIYSNIRVNHGQKCVAK